MDKRKKKRIIRICLYVLFISIIVASVVYLGLGAIRKMHTKTLVCSSPEGSITLNYDSKIKKANVKGIYTFDVDGANDSIKDIGIEDYLVWFKAWFVEGTDDGMCDDMKRLICYAPEGGVTLYYDDNHLIYAKPENLEFNLEAERNKVKDVGIDKYIENFKIWFAGNSSGKCE